jgi:hypothetical protein
MSLGAIVDRVERHERRVTLVSPPSGDVVSAVRRTFGPQGVSVDVTDGTGNPSALVRDGQDVVTTVPLGDDAASFRRTTDALTEALSTLDRTTFVSYDLRGMFATTREIEDRAWRLGRGCLRAGFQRVGPLTDQASVYSRLATTLEVHTYAIPDGDPPEMGDAVVHLDSTPELERSWFVVYDGGGRAEHKCALVAEERGPKQFSGFLTYSPALVDEVDNYLDATY